MQQGGRAMKRLILVCVMILCLLPVSCWTEEAASDLYPIREKGLWGYMNRTGEVMIEPQWLFAEAFSDGWAIVESDNGSGLIDTSGIYAIQPSDCIRIEEYAHAYTVYDYELEGYGFFDKTSGFYQVPLADYENTVYTYFGGNRKATVRSTAMYSYLDKINAFVLVGQAPDCDVEYIIHDVTETENTYRLTVSFIKNNVSVGSYDFIFRKRDGGDPYIWRLSVSTKVYAV